MTDYGYDATPEETQDIPLRSGALEESFLLQPVETLMHTKIATSEPGDTVKSAVTKMVNRHCGCVVVVEDGKLVGILSERDIVTKLVADDLHAKQEIVSDHMTYNPECLNPEDEVAYALNIMMIGGIRHVPVVDDEHNLVGIFSIRDLQAEIVGHFEKEILTLPPRPHRFPHRRYAG